MTTILDSRSGVKPEIMIDPSIFSSHGDIEIFAGEGQTDKNNIRLTLYDGSIVKHWYWGNLAFDLATMKLAKPKIPILDAHNTDRPLGYSINANFEGKFTLDGKFLKNSDIANKRKNELEEGFPYEASLRFDMNKSQIQLVRENETAEVNGRQLAGPGAVIRRAIIMEGSMCVFGALNNCKTENFENVLERFSERNNKMAEVIKVTLESFEKDQPEIFKQIFDKGKADGEKKERDLFTKLVEACGDDAGLTIEMYKSGKMPEEAMAERNKRLAEANKKLAEQLSKKAAEKVDPAKIEFSDEQKKSAAEKQTEDKTDDELKAEFAASKDLQEEFGIVDAYLAYIKAEKNGQVSTGKEK